MIQELQFMSDRLEKNGIKEGDFLKIWPFSGKSREYPLNRTKYNFSTFDNDFGGELRPLEAIQKEKICFVLTLEKTKNLLGQTFDRYILKSANSFPFKHNGSYVLSAILEAGDLCEIGYHRLTFYKKKPAKDEFSPIDNDLLRHGPLMTSNLPILIEGETGVGKTSLAKSIHKKSGRVGSFVHVNISSYSSSLMESELFGHIKGAFTGAIESKKGALRESHGGTLFLDEIDSLPIETQTKLLIFLDDFLVRPVGGERDYKVDTRLIVASGKNLMKLQSDMQMRKDFYFRISSGKRIKIPALRENTNQIEKVCKLFMVEKNIGLSKDCIDFYKSLPWPGNIRQLKGHLEKKFVISKGRQLSFDEQDEELLEMGSSLEAIECQHQLSLKELKERYIIRTFYKSDKKISLAAKKLKASPRSIKKVIDENIVI